MEFLEEVHRILLTVWPVTLFSSALLVWAGVLHVWDWCEDAPEGPDGPSSKRPPVDYRTVRDQVGG